MNTCRIVAVGTKESSREWVTFKCWVKNDILVSSLMIRGMGRDSSRGRGESGVRWLLFLIRYRVMLFEKSLILNEGESLKSLI